MRLLASALLVLAASGCILKDSNHCALDNSCPIDAREIDAPIDGRMGCDQDPGICTPTENCLANVCVDCRTPSNMQDGDCETPEAPVCRTDNDCHPCMADSECTARLCFEGACPSAVLFIAPGPAGNDEGGARPCTNPAMPCRTLTHALTRVPAIGGDADANRRTIRVAPGAYDEPGQVVIDDKAVVIAGLPTGARPVFTRSGNGTMLRIANNADVHLDHIAISMSGNMLSHHGIDCSNATLVADDVELDRNRGVGLRSDGCTLTVTRSIISANGAGGIDASSGTVRIVNNVIVRNGNDGSAFGGVSIGAGVVAAGSALQSNTIVGNSVTVALAPDGVVCPLTGLTARNNIIYGANGLAPRVAGACPHVYTLFGPTDPGNLLTPGEGNMLVDSDARFLFRDPPMRDYRLMIIAPPGTASVARDKGTTTMAAEEAAFDLEGQGRPQGLPDVGADEIP